ncbi:hypothetical protein [Lacunimicrobium album]
MKRLETKSKPFVKASEMVRKQFHGISDQRKAGQHRLEDARNLIDGQRWRGGMYLAGYSIECLLKVKLMQIYECDHLEQLEEELQRRKLMPSQNTVFTHSLGILLNILGAKDRMRQDMAIWKLFATVNLWTAAWRYNGNASNANDAEDFYNAVCTVRNWIEHNT